MSSVGHSLLQAAELGSCIACRVHLMHLESWQYNCTHSALSMLAHYSMRNNSRGVVEAGSTMTSVLPS